MSFSNVMHTWEFGKEALRTAAARYPWGAVECWYVYDTSKPKLMVISTGLVAAETRKALGLGGYNTLERQDTEWVWMGPGVREEMQRSAGVALNVPIPEGGLVLLEPGEQVAMGPVILRAMSGPRAAEIAEIVKAFKANGFAGARLVTLPDESMRVSTHWFDPGLMRDPSEQPSPDDDARPKVKVTEQDYHTLRYLLRVTKHEGAAREFLCKCLEKNGGDADAEEIRAGRFVVLYLVRPANER